MEICVNGKSYIVNKIENETDKLLASRIWFIIKQNPTNEIDFLEAEKNSIVWYYMKYYNCIYEHNLQNKINKLVENLYD